MHFKFNSKLKRYFSCTAQLVVACSVIFLATYTSQAIAQIVGTEPAPVEYIVSPETPGANENVTIQANGVGNFLGDSNIIWTRDGVVEVQGYGQRTFNFGVGNFGTQTKIGVTIQSKQYGIIRHQWIFNPSFINLVWEAQTTVPTFYEGKAMASPGATITVTAFPVVSVGGVLQNYKNLSFNWKLNDENQMDWSGVGRNSFTFTSKQIHQSEDVSVEVLLSDGNTKAAQSEITVPIIQPEIVLYEHDPLRGVLYKHALGNTFSLQGAEMTIRAEPYFFSIESVIHGSLQYGWQLNDQDTSGPSSAQGELTMRQTGSGKGTASLNVSLQNNDTSKLLQDAQFAATILFGGTQTGSLFGL